MASPLHDNPRSANDDKKPDSVKKAEPMSKKDMPEKKDDEPRNEKGQTQGEERDDVSDKSPMGEEAKVGPREMFMDGMRKIRARHERERRDHHGNHREALRQMGSRHDKEIADHFDMHFPAEVVGSPGGETPGGGTEGSTEE